MPTQHKRIEYGSDDNHDAIMIGVPFFGFWFLWYALLKISIFYFIPFGRSLDAKLACL
jgi:hypothetical protein